MKKFLIIIMLVIVTIIMIMIFQLNLLPFNIKDEISRIESPDGKVEAILVQNNGGATTSESYHLYLVPKGSKFKNKQELFIADHVQNLKIKWLKEKQLQISYDEARIFHFSNFWQSKKVENLKYIVGLQLKQN